MPWSSTINQRKVPTPVTDKPLPIPLMLMLLTLQRVAKTDLQFDGHAEAPVSMQMALPPTKVHGFEGGVVGALIGA